jgi:hypothetical protein
VIIDQLLSTGHPRSLLTPWELNIIYIQLGDPSPPVKWKRPIKQSNKPWPKFAKIHLRPFEMLYMRPFLSNTIVIDPETDRLLKYGMGLVTFRQAFQKLRNKVLWTPTKVGKLHIEPGDRCSVILARPMAVKLQGMDSWIHLSRLKHEMEDSTPDQAQPGDTYSCEPIET